MMSYIYLMNHQRIKASNNLSWSNLFNNLEKDWLLLSTLFLLIFFGLNTLEVPEFYVFLNLVAQFHFVSQVVLEFGRKKP
jgi:hypothetical protein